MNYSLFQDKSGIPCTAPHQSFGRSSPSWRGDLPDQFDGFPFMNQIDWESLRNFKQQSYLSNLKVMSAENEPGRFSLLRVENLFLLNGITSLLGWNAVLSSMDYYGYVYDPHNIPLWFPVPLFVAYLTVGVLFNWLSRVRSYQFLVTVGIFIVNACLLLLFLFSLFFKDSVDLGFGLSLILCFFIGIGANSAQLSFFAMINYLGQKVVSRFTIGTAISGLAIVVLRMIIVAILGSQESNVVPICLFTAIAIAFNFFDLGLNLKYFRTEEYKVKIEDSIKGAVATDERRQLLDDARGENYSDQQSYVSLMWKTAKAIHPYPLFIGLDFVFTFMLFPALTFQKKMDINITWSLLIFNLMYNIGDTLGKVFGDFRKTFNYHSMLFTLLARLYFFYTIPIMDRSQAQDDILLNNNFFPFFNQLIFGITNGFVINGSFILAFEKCPDQYKKYAGVLGGICLQLGIMVGSFLAIPFEMLVDPVK